MKKDITHIWETYTKNKNNRKAKERLLLNYIPLVRYVAGRMMISLPKAVILDDLISNGVIGLISALDKFDPTKDIKFETYANIKIRGAILDGLREMDWMPRNIREKSNILEKAIKSAEKKHGKIPSEIEIAEELNISMDDYYKLINDVKIVTLLSLDKTFAYNDGERRLLDVIEDNQTFLPDEVVERKELKSILVKSIKELKENEKNVIALYYYEQLTLKEIGKVLAVSESRISQIHTKVIIALRNKIQEYLMIKKRKL